MNPLWKKQIQGILRLELRKNLFSLRTLPVYALAALPVVLAVAFVLAGIAFGIEGELRGVGGAVTFFAALFAFTLNFLFFSCVFVFMNLFRGEILDRSLHYYFLTPVRREVLVAGKFLSGWATTTILFSTSTLLFFLLIHGFLIGGEFTDFMLRGAGLSHLISYLAVTAMGILGYGSLFLFFGLFVKNPLVPAIAIYAWELLNPLLPAALKKISVIFYLQSMLPVPLSEGPLAVIADPVPAWIAVGGMLLLSAIVLVASALKIRNLEISYAAD